MPDLSVVIPTFDTASMTLRCCRAVLASMPDSAEVIVVDDGSSDGTAELLAREVPEVQVARLDANRGFATAANLGVASARSDIILLLNSDAVVEKDALRAIAAAFHDDEKLGVAGAQLIDDDGASQWSGGQTPTLLWIAGVVSGAGHLARIFRRHSRSQQERRVDWVSGAAMAFRRQVWQEAGPLDERFLFYCQDISFCLRARDSGWSVRVLEEARVIHEIGGTIASGSPLHHDPERLWIDLLDWGGARYGRLWLLFARLLLVSVAWLRVAGRKLRSPMRRDPTTDSLVRAAKRLTVRSTVGTQSDS